MSNDSTDLKQKKKDFTMVDNNLLRYGVLACGDKARVLLLIMLMQYDHGLQGGPAYPSENRLAQQLGLSTRQVIRHLKALVEKGLISIHTRWEFDHRRNYYRVEYDLLKKILQQIKSELPIDNSSVEDHQTLE